ncbi:MAG: zf-HC2 domain-containing protein [Lachnospiraceae bacterium]|nr:zf-HC2 domain-containing protein [Lachnospiraceae bacterium]
MGRIREISCAEAEDRISPYIDGTLAIEDMEGFIHHVRHCRHCYEDLETDFFIYYTLDLMDKTRVMDNSDVGLVLRHDLLRHENAYRQYQRRRRIFGALVGAAELLLAFMLLMEQVGSRDLPFFSQITAWVMSLF